MLEDKEQNRDTSGKIKTKYNARKIIVTCISGLNYEVTGIKGL